MVSFKNQLLFEVSPRTLLLPQSSFRKTTFLPSLIWSRREYTWTVIFKEKLLCIPYPYKQSANGYITTLLLMVNITLVCKSLYDKYMAFTHFHLKQRKNRTWFVSLVRKECHGLESTTFTSTN